MHERATPPTQGRSNFESQKKSAFRVHETPLFFGRQIWAGVPVLGIAILRGVLAMFSRKLPFRVHGRPTSGGSVVAGRDAAFPGGIITKQRKSEKENKIIKKKSK